MNDINIFAPKSTVGLRKLGENNMQRFETDIILNGKTKYQDKDNMINSLQEEIKSMKYKMSFYFEKEKEIQGLQKQLGESEKEINKLDKYKLLILKLKRSNDEITSHYKELLLEFRDYENIKRENTIITEKLKELSSKEKSPNITRTTKMDSMIEELTSTISLRVSEGSSDEDAIEDIGDAINLN
jgi:hypothetical protein|tara:strand:+ start:748 stop:1302 length:555 start_codon:yes stop_codon:yes gene_type:complete